jgi:gas vesicle protein
MSDVRGHSTGTLVLAFLAGAVAGAVVAVLTSPKSGSEVRESLRGLTKDGRARRAIDRVAAAARGAFDEAAGGGAS